MKRFFHINGDIFLRTICLSFAFAFLYSQASLEGEIYLAANVVLLQFLNWMSYGIDGFAFAAESLIGKYYGSGSEKKTFRAIKLIFLWGLGLAVGYAMFYWLAGPQLILLFTDIKEVVLLTNKLLFWVVILPIVSFACYIWDGIYIGLTASKSMRNTMLISLVIYFGFYYGTDLIFNVRNIWPALLVFLAARGLLQSLVYFRFKLEMK
jgi:MATE family multidrug resistance protein